MKEIVSIGDDPGRRIFVWNRGRGDDGGELDR